MESLRDNIISIIGSGYVGEKLGEWLKSRDHLLLFYDIDEEVLEGVQKRLGSTITQDLIRAVMVCSVSFIAVPTPSTEKGINLSYIDSVTRDLGKVLKEKERYHTFAIKSTITPGTTENIVIPNLEKNSGKKFGEDFGVVYNPEFLTAKSSSWTSDKKFEITPYNEDKIVIGENERFPRAGDVISEIYEKTDTNEFRTDFKTAEMIKYANNARLASAISFSNEIHEICKKLDINPNDVMEAVANDRRIGEYGSVAGKAFGGTCLPKDLRALIYFVEGTGYDPEFLKAIENVNERMKKEYGARE